jgi:hypothetical protein
MWGNVRGNFPVEGKSHGRFTLWAAAVSPVVTRGKTLVQRPHGKYEPRLEMRIVDFQARKNKVGIDRQPQEFTVVRYRANRR